MFIQSPIEEYLDCFQVLAIMNKTVNILMKVLCEHWFSIQSGISGLCSETEFSKKLPILQSCYTVLQWLTISIAIYPCQHLTLLVI